MLFSHSYELRNYIFNIIATDNFEFRCGVPPVSSPSGKNGGRNGDFVRKSSFKGGYIFSNVSNIVFMVEK